MSTTGKTNSIVLTEGPNRAAARAMLRGVGFSQGRPAQAHHRHRQHLDRDRPLQLPPARRRRRRQGRHPRGRRHAHGVQHRHHLRRHHHGHPGHEGLADLARSHRRLHRTRRPRQPFDGLVCIAGCDKNMPGAIMALARLDIPGLMLYGGSIAPGHLHVGADGKTPEPGGSKLDRHHHPAGLRGHRRARRRQDHRRAAREVEATACPGPGACGGQFTANTMAMAGEFLGISPIQLTGVPAMTRTSTLPAARPAAW
jgi:dihydroxy-acid dehydratase